MPSLNLPGRRSSRPDTASSASSTSGSYYFNASPIIQTHSSGSSSHVSSHARQPSLPSPISPIIPHTPSSQYYPRWNDQQVIHSPPSHDSDLPAYTEAFPVDTYEHITPHVRTTQPIPQADPPGYLQARVPITTFKYQFSALPNGAHLLLPPHDSPDTRSVYHIRTCQNTFCPSAHKTVIRRGGGDEGEFVGEFEFGMSSNKSYIFLHGKAAHLPRVLYKTKNAPGHISHLVEGHWTWSRPKEPSVHLYWDCVNRSAWTCTLPGKVLLATYNPPDIAPNRGVLMPTLKVTPAGQMYFDDLLIAALIFEQKAALPMFKEGNEYRSYYSF